MLKITIELVYAGRRTILATANAGLMRSGSIGSYDIHACEAENPLSGREAWFRKGVVSGHVRQSSVWRLVEKIAKWAGDQAEAP